MNLNTLILTTAIRWLEEILANQMDYSLWVPTTRITVVGIRVECVHTRRISTSFQEDFTQAALQRILTFSVRHTVPSTITRKGTNVTYLFYQSLSLRMLRRERKTNVPQKFVSSIVLYFTHLTLLRPVICCGLAIRAHSQSRSTKVVGHGTSSFRPSSASVSGIVHPVKGYPLYQTCKLHAF